MLKMISVYYFYIDLLKVTYFILTEKVLTTIYLNGQV